VEGQAGGDVQQAVAQALGFGVGELAGQQQALGPGDQVVGDEHELKPDAVVLEVAEGQVAQACVLVVADVVLDASTATMTALDLGDVAALVGEDRLEAVALDIGEAQLGAGVRAFAAHEHPRTGWPAGQVEVLGDLSDLAVGPRAAVLIQRANPAVIGDLKDRLADRLAQVIADREADPRLPTPVQQLMAGAGAVDPEQQVDVGDVLDRNLLKRLLGDGDLVSGGVRARVPGRSSPASASPV